MLKRDTKNGVIFGVCAGLAKALDLPVGIVRLCWIVSVLWFGVGFLAYILAGLLLSKE